MKIVQMVRMTTAQAGAYTGLVGQLVMDLGSGALRVLDGVTPGGKFTLMAQNNLADLPDKAAARNGLGLGSSATHPATDFDLAGSAATAQANAQAFATAADVTVATNAAADATTKANAAQAAAIASSNATSAATYLPKAGGTMTGPLTGADGGVWEGTGLHGIQNLGVGFAGAPSTIVDVRSNNNFDVISRIQNNSNGAGATVRYRADNGANVADFILFGTGLTPAGLLRAGGALLSADGAGGLTVATFANHAVFIGVNGSEVARFDTDGGFNVGNTTPAGLGGIRAAGPVICNNVQAITTITAQGEITAFASDIRLKTQIKPIDDAVNKVKKLIGVTYNWNDIGVSLGFDRDKRYAGLIAQNVQEVLPEAIRPAPADNRYLTYQPEQIIPLLVEAIKELKTEIEELKAR